MADLHARRVALVEFIKKCRSESISEAEMIMVYDYPGDPTDDGASLVEIANKIRSAIEGARFWDDALTFLDSMPEHMTLAVRITDSLAAKAQEQQNARLRVGD